MFWIVIRLKQVEHIRNERATLAVVAGHPFITTLITTFSDRECLYMLVCDVLYVICSMLMQASLTIALVAKSLHIYEEHDDSAKLPHAFMPQRLY